MSGSDQNYPVVSGIEAVDSSQKETPYIEVDLSKVKYIQKDINMVVLPYFYFSRGKRKDFKGSDKKYLMGTPSKIIYTIDNEKNKKMIVESSHGGSIPSAFDYEVVQVLLKYRQAYQKDNPGEEAFYCNVWGIAKELGSIYTDKNGKNGLSKKASDRIKDSIARLKKTQYELLNIYNTKNPNAPKSERYKKKQRVLFSILDSVHSQDDLYSKDSMFYIKFSDLFIQSIRSKYHFSQDINRLENIKKSAAKRLFELLTFRSNKAQEKVFSYEEIAFAIPINSGRKNRILINNYLKELKESAGVIRDYKADFQKGLFKVYFKDERFLEEELKDLPRSFPTTTGMQLFEETEGGYLLELLTKRYEILPEVAVDLIKNYKSHIAENLKYVESRLEKNNSEISNKAGYVIDAIKNNYQNTNVISQENKAEVVDVEPKKVIDLDNDRKQRIAMQAAEILERMSESILENYKVKAKERLSERGFITGQEKFDNMLTHSEILRIIAEELENG